jgi:hypothetical protein
MLRTSFPYSGMMGALRIYKLKIVAGFVIEGTCLSKHEVMHLTHFTKPSRGKTSLEWPFNFINLTDQFVLRDEFFRHSFIVPRIFSPQPDQFPTGLRQILSQVLTPLSSPLTHTQSHHPVFPITHRTII